MSELAETDVRVSQRLRRSDYDMTELEESEADVVTIHE